VKIAMIGQKGVPATYGGIERHVEEVSRRLVARGHDVTVYCRFHYTPSGGTYHGIRLRRLPSINTKHFDTATHVIVSTVDSLFHDFDVVHFHALGPSLFSFLPRWAGAKTVVTVHGLDWQREKWGRVASWVLQHCEYSAVRFPNQTIVLSRTLQNHFRTRFGRDTVVIPNGTHIPVPRPPTKLDRFGLSPSRYVLFVGRLTPEKGVHFLTEAFQNIGGDMKLAIVGGMSFTEGYVADLKKYESERIRMLGYVYGETLEELWSNAYVVVLPSTMEGLSLALLEALSHGRCVLMSDIPENMEVASECAVSFRSRDIADLRDKLQGLIDDPERVRHFETLARAHIGRHYTWDRVVDLTEEVYRELRPDAAGPRTPQGVALEAG
jgi:glycosyltransferase involved in cell wall biosynthesis